ncbi:MAG: hypothetical protein ACRDOU_21330 [Streptosporangiaceae bacterium]
MHPFTTQALVWDHIRESRQQAAAARRASAVRGSQRKAAHASRRSHRVARGA